MQELKSYNDSFSSSTLQGDAKSDTLKSSKRRGWAPSKESYEDNGGRDRPVSFTGNIVFLSILYDAVICFNTKRQQ